MSKKLFESYFKQSVASSIATKSKLRHRYSLNEAADSDDSDTNDTITKALGAELDGSDEEGSSASDPIENVLEQDLDSEISTFDPEAEDKYNQKYLKHMEHKIGQINTLLAGWADRIDEFVDFINDPEHDQGIRNILNSAISGTALEKIKVSELKTITKIAADAASLSQSLRSYIGAITADQMMTN